MTPGQPPLQENTPESSPGRVRHSKPQESHPKKAISALCPRNQRTLRLEPSLQDNTRGRGALGRRPPRKHQTAPAVPPRTGQPPSSPAHSPPKREMTTLILHPPRLTQSHSYSTEPLGHDAERCSHSISADASPPLQKPKPWHHFPAVPCLPQHFWFQGGSQLPSTGSVATSSSPPAPAQDWDPPSTLETGCTLFPVSLKQQLPCMAQHWWLQQALKCRKAAGCLRSGEGKKEKPACGLPHSNSFVHQ